MSLWVWIVLVWVASSPIAAVLLLPLMRASRAQRRARIYLSWRPQVSAARGDAAKPPGGASGSERSTGRGLRTTSG